MADLVLGAPLGTAGGRVATADDGGGLAGAGDDGVHQLLGAVGEFLELEDAGRSKEMTGTLIKCSVLSIRVPSFVNKSLDGGTYPG